MSPPLCLRHLLDFATSWTLPPLGLCHLLDFATFWTLPPSGLCHLLDFATFWTLPPSGLCHLLDFAIFWTLLPSGLCYLLDCLVNMLDKMAVWNPSGSSWRCFRHATRRLAAVVVNATGSVDLSRASRANVRRNLFEKACASITEVLPSLAPADAEALEVSATVLASLSNFSKDHALFAACLLDALSILANDDTWLSKKASNALLRYTAALARTRR